MKHFIAAVAALSMLAATSAAAGEPKPISTAQQYREFLDSMCGDGRNRMVPADDGNYHPCHRVALQHAMTSKKDSTDVRFGTAEYYTWSCEAVLIGRGKMFSSLNEAPSSFCRAVGACDARPGQFWDHHHGMGCVDIENWRTVPGSSGKTPPVQTKNAFAAASARLEAHLNGSN